MPTVYLELHLAHVENRKICPLSLSSLFHSCSGKCFSGEVQFPFSIHWAFGLLVETANNRAHAGCETPDWISKPILHQTVVIFAVSHSGIFRISDLLARDTKLKIQSYYQSPELATSLTIFHFFFIYLCITLPLLVIRCKNCGFTINLLPLLSAVFSLFVTLPDPYSKPALTQHLFSSHVQAQIFKLHGQNFPAFFQCQICFSIALDTPKDAEEDLHEHLTLHASN